MAGAQVRELKSDARFAGAPSPSAFLSAFLGSFSAFLLSSAFWRLLVLAASALAVGAGVLLGGLLYCGSGCASAPPAFAALAAPLLSFASLFSCADSLALLLILCLHANKIKQI